MKLSEFILLSEEEKKKILLHQGILIGKRVVSGQMVFLFQLQTYYIEVYCDLEDKNVKEYLAFEGTTPLQPYLETIAIDHLFQQK